MKENKYDDEIFFDKYSRMDRSVGGLEAAGEWYALKKLLPDFTDKRVLDLGCGFGWHCRYAVEKGAVSAVGVDISEKMLSKAAAMTDSPLIKYMRMPIEDIDLPPSSFDIIISSLVLHYVESFGNVCNKIYRLLAANGDFVFTVEHPIFTAQGSQDWYYGNNGNKLHWPVDRYFDEGIRKAAFLDEEVVKYHKTLTTYINALISSGFRITGLAEPQPAESKLNDPGMRDELRRPMMLIIAARKEREI